MNKKILAAMVGCTMAASAQATVLIDDFTVETAFLNGPATETTAALGASSSFDSRDLTISAPDGPSSANAIILGGGLGISTGVFTQSDTTLAYSGAVDFTTTETSGSTFDQFVISLTSIDQGGVDITMMVNGTSSTQFADSVGDVVFAHSLFGDVSNVTSLSVEIHNFAAVDATFSILESYGSRQVVTAPEPTSLALLAGGGLLAFGFAQRKAKR